MSEEKERFLDALRRAEAIAEQIAKDACRNVEKGSPAALEAARRALEILRRAEALRMQAEEGLRIAQEQQAQDAAVWPH